jgi:predicted regulator of Ras-like GTPase activity (Roadblock/LC7/MglB family)
VVESDRGFAIVVPAGKNTTLALFAEAGARLGDIAYQMQVQVNALTRAMNAPARQPDTAARP